MTESVRVLNNLGIEKFHEYLQRLRSGAKESTPVWILVDQETSVALAATVVMELKSFANRFEFGQYLNVTLGPLGRRAISHQHGLWTWLALYYFDEICPPGSDGTRKMLEDAVYILPERYNHQRYYRHIVRTAWLAVSDHADKAKVLLLSADRGSRSEIFEQIASRQGMLGNLTVVAGAFDLYFDTMKGRTKKGAGGKGPGSPRRLAAVVQQLELTYDLAACTSNQFLGLLPKEFDRFIAEAESK